MPSRAFVTLVSLIVPITQIGGPIVWEGGNYMPSRSPEHANRRTRIRVSLDKNHCRAGEQYLWARYQIVELNRDGMATCF